MPIPPGITRDHILRAVEELSRGRAHYFGEATKYELVVDGRAYSPKAVVGVAAELATGVALRPGDFSGGNQPGQANHLLRSLGFEVRSKDAGATSREERNQLDDSALVGATLDSLVEEAIAAGALKSHSDPDDWSANAEAVGDALENLERTGDVAGFSAALGALPNAPEWSNVGAHRTFISTIGERSTDPDAARVVADAYSLPEDQDDADRKIDALMELAGAVDRLYPGPGFAPLAVSLIWCMLDPRQWPWLSASAEPALHILRLLPRDLTGSERYRLYRELILEASHPPTRTVHGLAYVGEHGSTSLSRSVFDRLAANADLLIDWYETNAYPSAQDEERAQRHIHAVLGELDLFAKGMLPAIEERLVRDLVTSKTEPRVGYDTHLPARADGYAIFTIERSMYMPSIRVWATPDGLAVGAHFGQKKYDESYEVAQSLVPDLPDKCEFFEVRPHKEGARLRPAGRDPIRGELYVGRWFEGGLTGTDVGKRTLETVAELQSAFDRMVRAAGQAPGPTDEADDELAALYQEFLQTTGYPTEAHRTNQAERALMESVISQEGLLAFDVHEFRRIFNTARYGSPGPQSVLNSSLNQMSPEELDVFAGNLEFLLRGTAPLEDRINAMMDQGDRGVRGLGEAVITKLLAIEHPTEIIPVFVYRGPKGKARMLNLLGVREEGLDSADIGSRAVRSNELLRKRLAPLFGDDMYGMSRFLYWLSEREELEEDEDPIDRIGNLADEAFVARENLDEIVELLEDKGQVIFYGPPGTGKTYLARELAKALAPDPTQRMLVQFHPSTSYEDFFEGYRPDVDPDGNLTYRLVRGPLGLIADRARENPLRRYVMVIDEINRANLPKVFGELLFLLEYREESVRSLYRPDEPFELPKNLWFIGTMNTADRSIALVDAAMRRRFHFVPFFPNQGMMSDLHRRWLAANEEPAWVADLLDMVNAELVERLGGPHLQIGPSHLMRRDLNNHDVLRQIWTYSIHPFIEEQLYGDQTAIDHFRFDRVMKRFHNAASPLDPADEQEAVSEEEDGADPTARVE